MDITLDNLKETKIHETVKGLEENIEDTKLKERFKILYLKWKETYRRTLAELK